MGSFVSKSVLLFCIGDSGSVKLQFGSYLVLMLFSLVWSQSAVEALPGTGSLADRVDVRLFSMDNEAGGLRQVEILSPFKIVYPPTLSAHQGRLFTLEDGLCLSHRKLGVSSVVVAPQAGSLLLKNGAKSRAVSGKVKISVSRERPGLTIVASEPLRQYLAAAVGSEAPVGFPLEALKAQAVLVQSWLRARRSGIIDDTTSEICFSGEQAITPASKRAVDAVFGQFLTVGGKFLKPYFHSTCAGGISDADEIFSGKVNFGKDKTIICRYCAQSPFYKELQKEIPVSELEDKLGYLPLRILATDNCKRPLTVEVSYLNKAPVQTVSGYELWLAIGQSFGWGLVPGERYRFEREGDYYKFVSSGAGHGAGLCQWGACGLAMRKADYKEILHFYFPKAKVVGALR